MIDRPRDAKAERAEYTCAACGGVFERGWEDSEAEAEYQGAFPIEAVIGEPREIVCDDCYRKMVPGD
jgi:DNA-directed RNA polymerase subunit RPC12/RpoP